MSTTSLKASWRLCRHSWSDWWRKITTCTRAHGTPTGAAGLWWGASHLGTRPDAGAPTYLLQCVSWATLDQGDVDGRLHGFTGQNQNHEVLIISVVCLLVDHVARVFVCSDTVIICACTAGLLPCAGATSWRTTAMHSRRSSTSTHWTCRCELCSACSGIQWCTVPGQNHWPCYSDT
jgi:hypothetical protein